MFLSIHFLLLEFDALEPQLSKTNTLTSQNSDKIYAQIIVNGNGPLSQKEKLIGLGYTSI